MHHVLRRLFPAGAPDTVAAAEPSWRRRTVAIVSAAAVAGALLLAPSASTPASAAAPAYFTQVGSVRSVEYAGYRYFFANDDQHGLELWRTNGTASGTSLFIDINPGDAASHGLYATSLNSDANDNHYLLPTSNGLFLVGALCAGGTCSSASQSSPGLYRIDVAQKKVTLVASGKYDLLANLGRRVLLTDFLADHVIAFDSADLSLTQLSGYRRPVVDVLHREHAAAVVKGVAYFPAEDADGDRELWRSDGTQAGTSRVKNIRASSSSYPAYFTAGTSRFYFTADDGTNGYEIWTSDGTSSGTIRLTNHGTGTQSVSIVPNAPSLVTVGNRLYYYANTTAYGAELWTTSGTRESVRLVRNLGTGKTGAGIKHMTKVGSKLAFVRPGTRGDDVWVTNGTSKGTVRIASGTDRGMTPGAAAYYRVPQNEPVSVAGQYIYVRSVSGYQDLWQSGTVAETTKRIARHQGTSGRPTQLLPVGSRLFYTVPTKETTFAPTHYVPKFLTITAKKPPASFTNVTAPVIKGTARVGSTLTASVTAWKPSKITYTWQWYANGAKISKATSKTYKITSSMKGKVITVKVTGKKSGYKTTVKTSKPTKKVAAKP